MIIAKFLHILGFTLWVGGMFFMHMAMRPNAEAFLQAPQKAQFWSNILGRFFVGIWFSVALVLISGFYMMAQIGRPPAYVSAMLLLGLIMTAFSSYTFFSPYKRLKHAVGANDWQDGEVVLARIRLLTGINLRLGLVTIGVGALGSHF